MPTNPYDKIIKDATNVAAAGDDASPTGLEFLDNLLYPNLQQSKEFGQQVALQQMQNDWSVGGKFYAMKKAGINANVAASGIAGASSPSTGSPNSAVGAGAQGVAGVAQAAGALNEAVNAGVNAYEKFSLTDVERNRRKAEIRDKLAAALHNDWLAYSISELLPEQKYNQRADTLLKLANYGKAKEEKLLINKRIDEAQAHIDELKAQAYLYEQQGNLVMYQQTKTLYETEQIALDNDKKSWDKNWRDTYKYDPNAPVDVALEQAMVNDSGDEVIKAIGSSVENMSYSSRTGVNKSDFDYAYKLAFENAKANEDVNALFKAYNLDMELWKDVMFEMYKSVFDNPNDVQGVISKWLNQITLLLDNAKVSANNVGKPNGERFNPNAQKPSLGSGYHDQR